MLDLLRLSLTDATVAGTRYAYTLASYRALLTDASFYGHGRRHDRSSSPAR